jgi:hypothetical protein
MIAPLPTRDAECCGTCNHCDIDEVEYEGTFYTCDVQPGVYDNAVPYEICDNYTPRELAKQAKEVLP